MDQNLQRPERQQLMRIAAIRMSSLLVKASVFAAVVTLGSATARADEPSAVAPGHVPEPAGLYQGAMHGYTPHSVAGGTVIGTAGLAKLISAEHPLLLDVAEKDRKPPSMDKDMIWLPSHRSIPGAVFLQEGGKGVPDPAYAEAFAARVAALTGGDKAKPIITLCHPDCWGSWNAAKRLIGDGYTKVYWYPEGVEGWQAEHDTRVVKPDTAWVNSLPKEASQ